MFNILPVLLLSIAAQAAPSIQIVKTHMTGEMNSLRAVARGLGGTVIEVDGPSGSAPDYLIHSLAEPTEISALAAYKARHPRTKLINLGDPHAHRSSFDLILTSRVLKHEPGTNVVAVEGIPAQTADPSVTREHGLVAVMIGGITVENARELAGQLSRFRKGPAVSNVHYTITRSRRTPDEAWAAFQEAMVWMPEDSIFEKDYAKVLGRAERFVVTGDSMSMIADALKTGKPTFVASAPLEPQHRAFIDEQISEQRLRRLGGGFRNYRYTPLDTASEMARRILIIGTCESVF